MRRALIIGIEHYGKDFLLGRINDAIKMHEVLSRNEDGSPNFDCKKLLSHDTQVTNKIFHENIKQLFSLTSDVAILYFSGYAVTHGNLDGFLVAQDTKNSKTGISFTEILKLAEKSPANEVVMIFDCFINQSIEKIPLSLENTALREGISVLCMSRFENNKQQKDFNINFTRLIFDALNGGAADLIGHVKIASVYAYVDQAFGAWDVKPLFKSHVISMTPLRWCQSEINISILRMIPEIFINPNSNFPLDPSYEPDAEPRNANHEKIFMYLQQLRSARLVEPVGETHMYYAAINSKSCKLTPLGEFYWRLANEGRI